MAASERVRPPSSPAVAEEMVSLPRRRSSPARTREGFLSSGAAPGRLGGTARRVRSLPSPSGGGGPGWKSSACLGRAAVEARAASRSRFSASAFLRAASSAARRSDSSRSRRICSSASLRSRSSFSFRRRWRSASRSFCSASSLARRAPSFCFAASSAFLRRSYSSGDRLFRTWPRPGRLAGCLAAASAFWAPTRAACAVGASAPRFCRGGVASPARGGVAPDGREGAAAGAAPASFGVRTRLRLVSTTTDFDRPWLKLCLTRRLAAPGTGREIAAGLVVAVHAIVHQRPVRARPVRAPRARPRGTRPCHRSVAPSRGSQKRGA